MVFHLASAIADAGRIGVTAIDETPQDARKRFRAVSVVQPESIDQLLERARRGIDRLTPAEALDAQTAGALVVDIRPEAQRRRDGAIAHALVIDRNVLEWRLAPTSQWRIPQVSDSSRQVVLVCNQGYQSSLAAYTLRRLGLPNTADVIGGFEAWLAAGLPVVDQR